MSTITLEQRVKALDKKYIAHLGGRCPVCHSDEIEGSSFDVEAGQVWQKVWCQSCEAEWKDIYHLTGIEDLKDGNGNTYLPPAEALEEYMKTPLEVKRTEIVKAFREELETLERNGGTIPVTTPDDIREMVEELARDAQPDSLEALQWALEDTWLVDATPNDPSYLENAIDHIQRNIFESFEESLRAVCREMKVEVSR